MVALAPNGVSIVNNKPSFCVPLPLARALEGNDDLLILNHTHGWRPMGKCGQLAMGQCGQLGRSGAGREHDNGKLVVVLKEELEKLRKELEMERGSRGLSGVTGKERREVNHFIALCLLRGRPVCVCLLLQYLLQSCSRGGRGIVEDMCYERRRSEALVDPSRTSERGGEGFSLKF